MMRFQVFHHCVIGIDSHGTAVLVEGPLKLYRVMGGPYLSESSQHEGFDPMHGTPGLYRATIECRWRRGSFARVHAGEDPAVELTARDVEAEGFESLAIDRCDVVLGYAPARGSLTAQLSRALRRVRTRVLQSRVLQYC
jgi:hypothetical protein